MEEIIKIILRDGTIEYRNNSSKLNNNTGQLHRKDGPAIIYPDGTNKWYLNGELHRVDGPAAEYPDGEKKWYLNGKLHRTDGPAAEYPDGTKMWYLNVVKLTEDEFNKKNDTSNVSKTFDQDFEYSMKEQKLYTSINEFKIMLEKNNNIPQEIIELYNGIKNDYSINKYTLNSKDVIKEIENKYKDIPESDNQFSKTIVKNALSIVSGKLQKNIEAFARELDINIETLRNKKEH